LVGAAPPAAASRPRTRSEAHRGPLLRASKASPLSTRGRAGPMRRSEHHAPPCSVAGTYSTVDELAGMSPARYVTPDPDDDGYDEDVPADPPPPAADDDAAPDDEPVVGDADGGGGGGTGNARRWAEVLPDPSCCPALPLLLFALIGTVAFSFSRPPAALLQCGPATPLTLLLAPRPEAQSRTGAAARGSEEVARTQRARRGRARVVEQERRPHVRARALVCGTTLVACRARTCASGLRLGHSFVEKRDKPQTAGCTLYTKYPFNPCPIRLSDMPGQDGRGARTRKGY